MKRKVLGAMLLLIGLAGCSGNGPMDPPNCGYMDCPAPPGLGPGMVWRTTQIGPI